MPTIHSLAGFLEARAGDIVGDRAGALQFLARVSENDLADLKRNATRTIDRDKEGGDSNSRRNRYCAICFVDPRLCCCAACIEEDLEAGAEWLEPMERAWERVTWRLRPITACEIHGLRLSQLPYPKGGGIQRFRLGS